MIFHDLLSFRDVEDPNQFFLGRASKTKSPDFWELS
jgi:hypothetical protein